MDKKIEPGTGVDPKYKDTFDAVAIGLVHVDLNGKFIHVNDCLCHFLGYSQNELLKLTFQELSLPEDLPESFSWIQASLAGEVKHSFSKVKRYRHKDGHWVWAKLTTTLMRDADGQPDYFLSSVQDVADLKKAEAALDESLQKLRIAYQELKQLSLQDSLTGVLNTNAFRDHLVQSFERFKRQRVVSTLLFIDADKFKEINDQYGHLVGDEVLKNLASVLIKESRATDIVARYGGDEFAVLLNDSDEDQAYKYCERVGHIVELDVDEDEVLQLGVSYGICEISDEITSIEQWLEKADKLMYRDKNRS